MPHSPEEGLRALILAGIGAAAVTAEKSKEAAELLIKRGKLAVEQGRVLNEELKRNVKKDGPAPEEGARQSDPAELLKLVNGMTPEQVEALKAMLAAWEETHETDKQPDERTGEAG